MGVIRAVHQVFHVGWGAHQPSSSTFDQYCNLYDTGQPGGLSWRLSLGVGGFLCRSLNISDIFIYLGTYTGNGRLAVANVGCPTLHLHGPGFEKYLLQIWHY